MPLWLILTLAFLPIIAMFIWAAWASWWMCEGWGMTWEKATTEPQQISRLLRTIDPYLG